jgi:tetratricopeptide (TPR) repeat protein
MAPRRSPRPGQKPGQRAARPAATDDDEASGEVSGQAPGEADGAPVGYSWGDYVEALVAAHGSLAAVAWKLVERGLAEDAASVERAIRRLRTRGHRNGGLVGTRLLRAFGVPAGAEARARWMGLYHSPFGDLPVGLCLDQLRLWDRPPISESRARAWILLGLAGIALRRRDFADARALLDRAAPAAEAPAARIEHHLAMAYLATREHADAPHAEAAAHPHLDAARAALEAARTTADVRDPLPALGALDPLDTACFLARLADHARALALYHALPAEDVHPFASYRRDAGLAYGLFRRGERDEALALAVRACDHAGDGGYVRLRAMGLLMVARIQGTPANAPALDRAAAIAERLDDAELRLRIERARKRAYRDER